MKYRKKPPTSEHRCGACQRGEHINCSIWCFCDCATNNSAAPQELCTRCRLPLGKALNAFPHVPTEDGHRHEVCPQEGKADVEQCKVCYATPDAEGVIHHGKGCYQVSDEGGGESYVDVPPPATPRGDGGEAAAAVIRKLIEASKPLDPEAQKIVSENFWNLLYAAPQSGKKEDGRNA